MRTTKTQRPYRMRQRAEQVSQTRQRITEAAIRLHTTVGPANTSIASVADEAGVTRLTVYRHFPDLGKRARRGLGQIYTWYRSVEPELTPIRRDVASLPVANQEGIRRRDGRMADALVDGHARSNATGRQLRAAAGHLVTFATWRSLAIDQGLEDSEAAEIGARLLLALKP